MQNENAMTRKQKNGCGTKSLAVSAIIAKQSAVIDHLSTPSPTSLLLKILERIVQPKVAFAWSCFGSLDNSNYFGVETNFNFQRPRQLF